MTSLIQPTLFALLILSSSFTVAAPKCAQVFGDERSAGPMRSDFSTFDFDSLSAQEVIPILRSRWRTEANKLIASTRRYLGDQYLSLLLDPGVASRLDKLILHKLFRFRFQKPTANDLRESFSKSLGTRTMYRGMLMDPVQAEVILQDGISSDYHRKFGRILKVNDLEFDPRADIYRRVADWGTPAYIDFHPYSISLSENSLVAGSIAYWVAGWGQSRKSVYVFEVEIPVIDLVERSGLISPKWQPAAAKTWYYLHGRKLMNAADKRFEQWAFFHIPPEQITSIQQMDADWLKGFSLGSP